MLTPRGTTRSQVLLLGLVFCLSFSGAVRAEEDIEKTKRRYLYVLRASLLVVTPTNERSHSQGTGVLIEAKRRLAITNYHVVQEHDDVLLYFPTFVGRRLLTSRDVYRQAITKKIGLKGKVLAKDKKRDLALIQLESMPRGVRPLKLAKEIVKAGSKVHSIGNPGSSEKLWRYTPKKVEKVERARFIATGGPGSDFRMQVSANMIFTDITTKKGESGGPLFNDRAELVGITQGFIPSTGTGLYVDISELWGFLVDAKMIKKSPLEKSETTSTSSVND